MPRFHQYKTPPIDEAVCEFRFEPSQDWDPTIPGKLHVELANEYSGRPQERRALGLEWNPQEQQMSYNEGLARVQLRTDDGTRKVGVGPDLLSVHMLRPYHSELVSGSSGWGEFRQRIKQALNSLWKVVQPVGVRRVGLRYINKIFVPGKMVIVNEYLNSALPQVNGLPKSPNGFVSRAEYTYLGDVRIILSQGTIEAPENHSGYLLDLDVIWENPVYITKEEALAKTGYLRERERAIFESVITDKARELFDAS